jgi:nucleoside-diphosphate-sugar epimerase
MPYLCRVQVRDIAILGTGWLGLPLVGKLAAAGLIVRGSYRSQEAERAIRRAGGTPYPVDLPAGPETLTPFLENADVLVFTLPPGGRRLGELAPADYLEKIRCLSPFLDRLHLIFTSSTGVYGDGTYPDSYRGASEITPPAPGTHSGRAVLAAERFFMTHCSRLTILRLAGLYGPDRDPTNFFRNREAIPEADAPVNLVHREDVLSAIHHVIISDITGTFNVCAAAHPPKRTFYGELLRRAGSTEKRWIAGGGDRKTVDSSLLRATGWAPRYDDLGS